jgi:hypothetical protein
MNDDADAAGRPFSWAVRTADDGDGYKFVVDGGTYVADPYGRVYGFDDNGEMTFVSDTGVDRLAYPRLYGRHFALAPSDGGLLPRNVRVLLPSRPATRVLYVHDGQNVLRADSSIPDGYVINDGGWQLDGEGSAPADTMVVAIDNTADRFVDYTHTADALSPRGVLLGGKAYAYADFVVQVVRPLVARFYGEPAVQGVMGSSLGGLVSLTIAQRHPDVFEFAACLSSTFGWGSLTNPSPDDEDDTLFDRLRAGGRFGTVVYVDSGGGDGAQNDGAACRDSDGDGVDDDLDGARDNFCETVQMRDLLDELGWTRDLDLFWFWDAGPSGAGNAAHTESAWRFRARTQVFPLFSTLEPRR